MLYDIICPLCMKKYPANNVLFRHNVEGIQSNGQSEEDFKAEDLYLRSYCVRHGIERESYSMLKVVDPAFVPEQWKTYKDGMLCGVRSNVGYELTDRICPYCHNPLYATAGTRSTQQMSVIGYTHAGKTTFEASMIFQLTKDGIGCVNNTLDEFGRLDNIVESNIKVLMNGDPARPETQQINSSNAWNATEGYHGPYIFSLAQENTQPVALVFYDLPGEHFSSQPMKVKKNAEYIGTAQTCVFLIDLENISGVDSVISTMFTFFGSKMKETKVNLALVLYKADQISKLSIPSGITVPVPPDLRGHKPIDLDQIDLDSEKIRKFIVTKDEKMESSYQTICSELGKENIRFFLAQSFDKEGNFFPRGCDIPIIWSLAKQGLYPTKKSEQ